jgi:hypothetical protein
LEDYYSLRMVLYLLLFGNLQFPLNREQITW